MTRAAEILVVGGGPTGLALALMAHDLGAAVRIVERRPEASRPSRALIMHPRTLEVLRPLGVTERLLARADRAPEASVHLGPRVVHARLANLALADTAFPHLTLVRQMDVETVLLQALAERGVPVEWGTELICVRDAGDCVRATLRSSAGIEGVACGFIAGCDGPRSTVRRAAGIGWHGGSYREEVVLADVELAGDLAAGAAHVVAGRGGLLFAFALGERATWRLLATRPAPRDGVPFGQPGPAVTAADLQVLLDDAGLDAHITNLAWSARYRLQHRLAARLHRGRLFLAGDAAHAYSPATGQGMNTGIQDAINLGWKLAFAASATDPVTLLDSYDHERRPAIRRVLALTRLAFWAEASTGMLPALMRGVLAPLGAPLIPALINRRRLVAEVVRVVSQLRLAYSGSPLSVEGSPRLRTGSRPGQRLPDATVACDGCRVRLHARLARPGFHELVQRDADWNELLFLSPYVVTHRLTSVPGTGGSRSGPTAMSASAAGSPTSTSSAGGSPMSAPGCRPTGRREGAAQSQPVANRAIGTAGRDRRPSETTILWLRQFWHTAPLSVVLLRCLLRYRFRVMQDRRCASRDRDDAAPLPDIPVSLLRSRARESDDLIKGALCADIACTATSVPFSHSSRCSSS